VPAVQSYPRAWQITTGDAVNQAMAWINVHFFDTIEAVKAWLLINLMVPFKRLLLGLPWIAVVAAAGLAGWQQGGWRLALLAAGLALFIALNGQWVNAMETVYLCGISVLIACAIGIPIGVLAARRERAHRVAQTVVDTLQTLPAFAYLIPAVMLFRVGDFAAMLAVVAYAIVPAIRYTDHGIRQIDPALIEAATAAGCTKGQILRKVQLPLALPEIMLGVNQTIMMALSMLVITALVGTRDLGQEVYIALTKADVGRGLVAGICVACLAMIADRLIAPWAAKRKRRLGLA
jgi:glycine betaine/proline transport system permease protein